MKLLIQFSVILLMLTGCIAISDTANLDSKSSNISPKDERLFHEYETASSENSDSKFAVKSRTVELEYKNVLDDTLVSVKGMMTTGFNEGEILNQLEIVKTNGDVIKVTLQDIASREYVNEYSYNTTTPTTTTQQVFDPGGTSVVVQSDGTHKTVTTPAKYNTVTNTTNITTNHTGARSQLFNEFKFDMGVTILDTLRNDFIDYYLIKTVEGEVEIIPHDRDLDQLYHYLFVD